MAAMVQCPVCHEEVELNLASWHDRCGGPEYDDFVDELRQRSALKTQKWTQSKKGNSWFTNIEDVVVIVTQGKRGQWSCGGVYKHNEDKSDKPLVHWKSGFRTKEDAQEDILQRVNEYLLGV